MATRGMGANSMGGTPWHVEVLRMDEFDERRHRGRCVYYNSSRKTCSYKHERCCGSSHCDYYKEREIYSNRNSINTNIKRSNPAKVVNPANRYNGVMKFPIGSRVSHKKYGIGVVREVDAANVGVEFPGWGMYYFDMDYCLNSKVLTNL